MRSLSFLLVTYYAVLRLFVTQIVPDVPTFPAFSSPSPCRPFAVAGEPGRLKIAWLAKLAERGNRDGLTREKERERGAFNQRPKAPNDDETNSPSLRTLSNFPDSEKL